MSDVIAIKTISNEEVVATVEKETEEYYVLGKPRGLVMQQAQDGSVSLGMLPFMASANSPDLATESDVILYKNCIMAKPVSVPPALEKAYLTTVSPIELLS